ncbi:MAG: OsmC/Ohr family protein [Ktedonobacterales bacterium]|jgi:putative redox protein|nr:MAG: OsmC/Ohr family protein [Ktedonobacterales bacterium]
MATKEMSASAVYAGGMRFDVTGSSGFSLVQDTSVADGGANSGFRPIELLLVALAGCTGMDVISILKKKRQDVRAYEVKVHGVRAPEHPMVFVDITVEHVLTGHNIDPAAVARAIELSDTKYCGVGNTLDKTAKITSTYHIVESGE